MDTNKPRLKFREWLRQKLCRHEFRYEDMALTGIPKPPEPDKNAGYQVWLEYLQGLDKSDWHTKRVRWTCSKCGRVFEAHCGLDILQHGRVIKT
jgi:hypothetical protein